MSTNKRMVRTKYGLITGQNIMHPLKIFIKQYLSTSLSPTKRVNSISLGAYFERMNGI